MSRRTLHERPLMKVGNLEQEDGVDVALFRRVLLSFKAK